MLTAVRLFSVELVQNLAVLVAVCAISGVMGRHLRESAGARALQGLLFGSAAIVTMLAPFQFTAGIQFDARSVALSVCGAFFGPAAALTAAILAAACRIALGGGGTITGLLVIASSAAIGVLFFYRRPASDTARFLATMLALGLAVHAVMLALMFTLPGGAAWEALPLIAPTVLVFYPLATALIATILSDQFEARALLRRVAESEESLRMAGELARVGGWSIEPSTGALQWTPQVAAMLDLPAGHPTALQEVLKLFPPASRAAVDAAYQACAQSGAPFDLEVELLTARDRRIWVRTIARPERDQAGAIVRIQGAVQEITVLKNFERLVAQSASRFHQLADTVPLFVWTATPDGTLDFTNAEYKRYAGSPEDAEPGSFWIGTIHPSDRKRVLETWEAAVRQLERYSCEFRVRRHDGEYRWHCARALPLRDESGEIVKWCGTGTDIHDTKLNEVTLSRMAARLRTTLESITDAFYILDRNWRFTYLNSEAERLLRHTRDEMLGRRPVDFFPDAIDGEVAQRYRQAFRSGEAAHFETYFEPFGQWFEVHAYPSDEGLAVYFRDITSRVQSEAELRAVSNRLQNLLEFSPLLITELDCEGRYLMANKAVANLMGRPAGEIVGRHLSELLPPDSARLFLSRIQQVQASQAPLSVEDLIPVRDQMRTYSTVLFPLLDESGAVASVAGVAQDITEQKAAREERDRLESQLRQAQKLEAVGQLAGGVAHDFNNMLGVILGHTEMLLSAIPQDDPIYHQLEEVQHAATRSAELTRQLLAFARKQTIAPKVLDLTETVSGMLKILRRLVGEDIPIEWRPGSALPVLADPSQVDQVVANLAVNARDAIGGNGAITLETAAATFDAAYCQRHPGHLPGEYAVIAMRDTGCGMNEETVSHIFEPFFTTKAQGSGTGLGLATVYGIVQQNRGFVTVSSTPGSGSDFRVYFPIFRGAAPASPAPPPESHAPGGEETVLLVEDEAALLQLSKRMLQGLGYNVLAADTPGKAIDIASSFEGRIDLLITDVVMPEMNGRELREKLDTVRPGLRTLFMSGYTADVIDRRGALDSGVYFLSKPFKIKQLAAMVREALDRAGAS